MAATDARPIPKRGVAYRLPIVFRNASGALVGSWTGADSEVCLDWAGYADCTNEATEVGTTGTGYLDLTAAEMNADCVLIKVTVTNSGAIPLVFSIYPEEAGDIRADVEQWKGSTAPAMTGDAYARIGAPAGASLVDDLGTATAATQGYVLAVKAKTDNLPAAPAAVGDIPAASAIADAVSNELTAEHPTAGSLANRIELIHAASAFLDSGIAQTSDIDAVDAKIDIIDGVVDAIKLKTDALPAAPASVGDIPSADTITNAVLDEILATHDGAGTAGKALIDAAAGGAGLTQQQVRDSLKLAASAGAPVANSVDDLLADIKTKTETIPTSPASVDDIPTVSEITDGVMNEASSALALSVLDAKVTELATANEIATEVLAATVDGLPVSKVLQAILSVLCNITAVDATGVSFKARNGSTEVVRVEYGETDGERTSSEIS